MADPYGADSLLSPRGGDPYGGDSLLRPAITSAPSGTVKSISDAIASGFEDSGFVRLMRSGKGPSKELPEDAPWYYRMGKGAGSMAGDFIPSIAGALAATPTGPVGMMAGGFAAPMALREAVVEAYVNNHAWDLDGVLEIGKAAFKGGAKGAVIGAATGGAGKVLAPVLGQSMKGAVALTAAEVGTMTSVSFALEGKVPTWQDFMDNAILLGGVKAAVGTAKTLARVWKETGKTPEEVRADAARDPTLAKELVGPPDPRTLPAAYEPIAVQERIKAALAADPRPDLVSKILTDPDWKPTANEPPPVKTDYLTDRASIAGVAGEIGRIYEKEIESATRGTVTNRQSLAEAIEVFGKGLDPREVGEGVVAKEAFARAILARSAMVEAAKARADYMANPADMGAQLRWLHNIELVAATQRDFRSLQAETGRAMQALKRIKYDPAFLPEATEILKSYNLGKTPIGEAMAAFEALKDPSKQAAFAREITKAGGFAKFVEAWRAGIFSGVLTWEANIFGNVGKWAVDAVERPIAAAFEATLSKEPLKGSQIKARALAPFYGLQLAVMDGLKYAGETIDLIRQNNLRGVADKLGKTIEGQDGKIDVLRQANDPTSPNPVERGAAHFVKFSFGALKLQDIPFRTVGERMEAYKMAVDRVARETDFHPSTPEWNRAVMRYVQEPTLGMSAEKAAATAKAIEAAGDTQVFSSPLGPRMARMSAALSGTPWEFLFPARRTPANILDWAVQHTPVVNFFSSGWRADFMAGGERQSQALARVVVGTGLAVTAYWLAQEGLFTGGNLADKEMSATKEGARAPNYSLKVGDTYYSLARFEPVAKTMMLAADLVEISKSPKLTEEDRSKAITMMILAFGNATISTTYLSGLANAMKAVTDPERYGQNLAENYATTLVPKIVGQPAMLADPYKREVDGIIDAIQSQIPYLREQLVAKRDVWGEKVENERLFAVMPVSTTKAAEDKVKTEAMRLYLGISRAPDYVMEKGPFKPTEKRTKLSPEQKDVLQEVSGKFAMQELSRIVNSPDWDKIPDFAQIAVYRKILEAGTKIGTVAALPPDAPERVARRQKILQQIMQQSQQAEERAPERRVRVQ